MVIFGVVVMTRRYNRLVERNCWPGWTKIRAELLGEASAGSADSDRSIQPDRS